MSFEIVALLGANLQDTEVGVAWLGTLCQTSSNKQDGNQVVSGTGVSSFSKTEWNLIAHEIGHGFGAIHDVSWLMHDAMLMFSVHGRMLSVWQLLPHVQDVV